MFRGKKRQKKRGGIRSKKNKQTKKSKQKNKKKKLQELTDNQIIIPAQTAKINAITNKGQLLKALENNV